MLCNNGNIVYVYDNKITTEIWRVHILWIFQITKITRAKSPIQNCLRGGFRERVGIICVIHIDHDRRFLLQSGAVERLLRFLK